jgi:signal transduction histidine kinase
MAPAGAPGSLHALLQARRKDVISRWSDLIREGLMSAPLPQAELLDHVPDFVDEITQALQSRAPQAAETSANAVEHGAQRLRLGFDVSQVVREYGLLHRCVLQIAEEARFVLSHREQQTLADWINVGIADATVEYVAQRDAELQRRSSEHLGFMAHELRNPLGAALLATQRLRSNPAGPATAETLDLLERNLRRTNGLIDNALSQASVRLGAAPLPGPLPVKPFLEDVVRDSTLEARARQIEVIVTAEPAVTATADPKLLRSAVANLVQNALKFSRAGTTVTVRVRPVDDRVTIDVEDACGGLPPGKVEELFNRSVQRGDDRTGFGFGLAIARQAVEAQHGTLTARDIPGVGCLFSITLPSG